MVQAADQGWSSSEQVGALGVSELELAGLQGGRKVQAWLYDSLNKGLLAGRIQALMLMSDLLEDWYFSWGLLRTEGSLQDVLMELVKVTPLFLSRLSLACLVHMAAAHAAGAPYETQRFESEGDCWESRAALHPRS